MAQATRLQFNVPDMDCDGCVASINNAVKRVDALATVAADLKSKNVVVATMRELPEITAAIEDAGFTVHSI